MGGRGVRGGPGRRRSMLFMCVGVGVGVNGDCDCDCGPQSTSCQAGSSLFSRESWGGPRAEGGTRHCCGWLCRNFQIDFCTCCPA